MLSADQSKLQSFSLSNRMSSTKVLVLQPLSDTQNLQLILCIALWLRFLLICPQESFRTLADDLCQWAQLMVSHCINGLSSLRVSPLNFFHLPPHICSIKVSPFQTIRSILRQIASALLHQELKDARFLSLKPIICNEKEQEEELLYSSCSQSEFIWHLRVHMRFRC